MKTQYTANENALRDALIRLLKSDTEGMFPSDFGAIQAGSVYAECFEALAQVEGLTIREVLHQFLWEAVNNDQ
jgi:hypothetical protein